MYNSKTDIVCEQAIVNKLLHTSKSGDISYTCDNCQIKTLCKYHHYNKEIPCGQKPNSKTC